MKISESTEETNGGLPLSEPPVNSYGSILKATSIIGGSQAINYLIGMVRTKLVAILLGPSGVGMVGLFNSSISWVLQLTGLGIASSGVREIAKAHGDNDAEQIGKTVRILRRACWVTGIVGWIVVIVLSRPLSVWAFESPDNAWLIAVLGATLLLTAISGGQKAIIQGTRRISDLARMTVISSAIGTVVAVAIYAAFGINGIVPVLISIAAINLTVTWWFARRIEVPPSGELSWPETLRGSKQLTGLGVAFMWSGLLASLVDMGIRALIIREVSLDATGYYQAAWGLSGMFANFILGAMGADFYPRLTAIADDHSLVKSMVNEQIEIGMLIALPGLLGTLALGPLLITIFYSSKFIVAATVLPWFIVGIFCRVVSWPVGFSILAKGATKWYFLTQTAFYSIQMLLVWMLIQPLGLVGVGVGFFLTFIPVGILNVAVAYRLTGFVWSAGVFKMFLISAGLVTVGFLATLSLTATQNAIVCCPLAIVSGLFSARGIAQRVGKEHRIVKALLKIPGARFVLPK